MSKYVAVLGFSAVLACHSVAIADGREQILKIFQRREIDWNSKDVRGLVSDFLEGAEYFNTDGESFEKRSQIEAQYKDVFRKIPHETELKLRVERINFLKQDLAIMDAQWILESSDLKTSLAASSVAVMCKEGNTWKIASLRETIHLPPSKDK